MPAHAAEPQKSQLPYPRLAFFIVVSTLRAADGADSAQNAVFDLLTGL
jgi:hypothetical protein